MGQPFIMHEFNPQQSQYASASPSFDFESNQQEATLTGFGDCVSGAPVRAPYNADTFVDSLLNDDFSGHDFASHDFSRDPFVTEDDEILEI